jgi:hypothetical protein
MYDLASVLAYPPGEMRMAMLALLVIAVLPRLAELDTLGIDF